MQLTKSITKQTSYLVMNKKQQNITTWGQIDKQIAHNVQLLVYPTWDFINNAIISDPIFTQLESQMVNK